MRTRFLFMSSRVALGLLAFACSGKRPPPKEPTVTETVSDGGSDADAEPPKPKPLFERLGGKEGIEKIVDAWLKNMAANVTKKRFAKLSKDKSEAMKKKMIDQLCKEAGGDCEYAGKSMKDAHKGMKITEAEWNAMVKALHAAIEESGVGQVEQDDVLALVAVMRDEIVEQKAAPKK
jgi:hemoglobin